MVKIYTRFQTKTAQKPYPFGGGGEGGHTVHSLYRGVPPEAYGLCFLGDNVFAIECTLVVITFA